MSCATGTPTCRARDCRASRVLLETAAPRVRVTVADRVVRRPRLLDDRPRRLRHDPSRHRIGYVGCPRCALRATSPRRVASRASAAARSVRSRSWKCCTGKRSSTSSSSGLTSHRGLRGRSPDPAPPCAPCGTPGPSSSPARRTPHAPRRGGRPTPARRQVRRATRSTAAVSAVGLSVSTDTAAAACPIARGPLLRFRESVQRPSGVDCALHRRRSLPVDHLRELRPGRADRHAYRDERRGAPSRASQLSSSSTAPPAPHRRSSSCGTGCHAARVAPVTAGATIASKCHGSGFRPPCLAHCRVHPPEPRCVVDHPPVLRRAERSTPPPRSTAIPNPCLLVPGPRRGSACGRTRRPARRGCGTRRSRTSGVPNRSRYAAASCSQERRRRGAARHRSGHRSADAGASPFGNAGTGPERERRQAGRCRAGTAAERPLPRVRRRERAGSGLVACVPAGGRRPRVPPALEPQHVPDPHVRVRVRPSAPPYCAACIGRSVCMSPCAGCGAPDVDERRVHGPRVPAGLREDHLHRAELVGRCCPVAPRELPSSASPAPPARVARGDDRRRDGRRRSPACSAPPPHPGSAHPAPELAAIVAASSCSPAGAAAPRSPPTRSPTTSRPRSHASTRTAAICS